MELRLAAILISDIVGYTKLMETDTQGTVTKWTDARDTVVEPEVESKGGRLVKFLGDGFLAEFSTVQKALECAIAIQNGVRENSLKFRMAVHLGDIIDDGKDIYGEGINIASRLEGIAEPGGICISGDVYNQVQNRIPAFYEDIGPQEVKNVAKPIQAYAVRFENMPGSEKTIPSSSEAGVPSIAVLPFDNMSGDPEQEYFTDGIVEDIITELSFIKNLRVIARNSSFTYKGKPIDIRKVGDELDVGYVLEGSVRKVGNDVRITAQLILTSDNSHRWAKRYDGTLENIFELQTDISQKIAEELDLEFSSVTDVSVGEDAVKKKEAHDIARRGRAVISTNNEKNLRAARKFYNRAIEIDDNCALAFAGLGHADVITGWHYEYDQHERKNRFISGADLAIKAKELDSKLGLAYSTLMLSWLLQNEKNKAREIADEAIRICPNDPLAYRASGIIYNAMGDYDDAINSANTAIELDPLDHVGYLLLMNCNYSSGNFDGVIKIYERELSISSSDDLPPYDWSIILSAYLKVGKNDKVEYIRQQIERAFPEFGTDNLRMATAVLAEDVSMDLTQTAGPYLPKK